MKESLWERHKVGSCFSSCALVCIRELCSEVGIRNNKTISALGLKSSLNYYYKTLVESNNIEES